jgi:glycosyltransferase involved in cell wall biosynthesis
MISSSPPLVSIVTPAYNAGPFLEECLESVLAQTYEAWEWIISNNQSTDSTVALAQRYAARDPRIRLCSTDQFRDVVQSHNFAFGQMSPLSKYCKVLHATDRLFPTCLSEMVRVAETSPSVGIVGAYTLVGSRVTGDGLDYGTTVLPGSVAARLILLGEIYPFWSPTSILIRSDFIRKHQPYYDDRHLHADVAACYDVLREADFGFVYQVLTHVREYPTSTSWRSRRLDAFTLSDLYFLVQYGPAFLNAGEYRSLLRRRRAEYHRLLARRLFYRKDRAEFWSYHRREAERLRIRVNALHLTQGLALEAAYTLLNLERSLKSMRLLRRLFGRPIDN